MSFIEQLYRRLPTVGQHAAVSAYGLWWKNMRLGGAFKEHVERFGYRDRFDADQWCKWQKRAVSEVLHLALQHVPYYRETWTPEQKSAARSGDLSGLPLLEKSPLRADPHRFVDQRRAGATKELSFYTSGSTGTPIASLWTPDELQASMAVREVRSAGWAGTSFRKPRATFSGRISVPDPNSEGPFHRVNLAEHQIYFSPFHLSPTTAHQYVDALVKHQIEWLTGYAVSYTLLAQFMLDQKIPPPPQLRAVVTTSEKLTAEMRQIMEQAYGCRVFDEYSTVENALFASECEHGSLHVSPDMGVVEILDEAGQPCKPGVTGEVVATQTMRRYQPLIRFRLGDMASWSDAHCDCGRAMPVLAEVSGRIEDVVRGPDGRELVRFHGVYIGLEGVLEGQIVQESLQQIRVRLVATSSATEQLRNRTEATVTDRIQQRLGEAINCEVEWVPSIERTAAGKFRAVVSKLAGSATKDWS